MAILSKGKTFTSTETVTSGKLHDLVDLATFDSGAVDGNTLKINTSGQLEVNEIDTNQIANDSVTADKIDFQNGTYAFKFAGATSHYTDQIGYSHSAPGALSLNIGFGNFRFITVSANITSVAAIGAANQLVGGHFTFILKYVSSNLSGPANTSAWNAEWLLPPTYDGTLTMTIGAVDMISGVIFKDTDDNNSIKYAVSTILNLSNPN